MLEKKIEKLGKYFAGVFPYEKGYSGVAITIPKNWVYYNKDNGDKITAVKQKENGVDEMTVILVGAPDVKILEIMDFAFEIIMNNKEAEEKKALYNEKIIELAKIFDSNRLSKLQNIVFKFEKTKAVSANKTEKETTKKEEV